MSLKTHTQPEILKLHGVSGFLKLPHAVRKWIFLTYHFAGVKKMRDLKKRLN